MIDYSSIKLGDRIKDADGDFMIVYDLNKGQYKLLNLKTYEVCLYGFDTIKGLLKYYAKEDFKIIKKK